MEIINEPGWDIRVRVRGDYIRSAIAIKSIHGKDGTIFYDKNAELLQISFNTNVYAHAKYAITLEKMLLNNV